MPRRPPAAARARVNQVMAEHRDRLARLAERRGVGQLKKLYDAAQAEQFRKLRAIPGRGDTFTAFHQKFIAAQLREGQAIVSRQLADELSTVTREAQVEGLTGLIDDVSTLETYFTGSTPVLPIEEASRFWGIVDERGSLLRDPRNSSMRRYGETVVGSMEDEIALSLAEGETLQETIDRLEEVTDLEWWQAERIARTECAMAYNYTQADGITELAEDVDDLYLRWTEHVSDEGFPLDDRVGVDSIAMHGQVIRPGGEFEVPPFAPDGTPVSRSLVGLRIEAPPNRPNDRACVSAWRPAWGGLAWLWQDGQRVPVESREGDTSPDMPDEGY